jgi:ubiquinone/menaquinone biosynthesis C-methylase UbiE
VMSYFCKTAAEWDEIYHNNDLYSFLYQERKKTVLSLVDEFGRGPGARALDVGCGPGLIALALAERGYSVEAIDAAAPMIELTRKLAAESDAGYRVRTSQCDIRGLYFADNSFDLVLAVGVMEWLPSLEVAMAEVVRVLKPGGVAIVTGDNRWALHFLLDPVSSPLLSRPRRQVRQLLQRLGKWPSIPRCYLRSVREIDQHLLKSELRTVRRKTLGFGALRFFNRKLFTDSVDRSIHHRLQTLADRNWPLLRSAGRVYIAAAIKSESAAVKTRSETSNHETPNNVTQNVDAPEL